MKKPALAISTILLAAFLLVGLLPIVLMSVLAFNETKNALTVEIRHDMQNRANGTASEIDRMIFERLQNVASWSQLEIMQDVRISDVDKRLSNFLYELKTSYGDVYLDLHVVDNSGLIVASSDYKKIGDPYVSSADWFIVAMPQAKVTINKKFSRHLPISTQIVDNIEALPLAKLVVEFNWQQIQNVLDDAVTGRSAAALFDAQELPLAITNNWGKDFSETNIRVSALVNGYQDLTVFGWRLEIAQHKSEVMAPVRRMTKIFIGLLIGSVILAALIGFPVARMITQPLGKLTRFTKNVINTPTRTTPPVGGPAEIRDMSNAFSKMLEDLELSKIALTRAAKLAVAGEMAAAMSHEVRTPLGILRSSAQVLLREPNLTQEGREVCGFITSETERLNKLVSTLIDSARPRLPEFSSTNISELAKKAIAMLLVQSEKKKIELILTAENNVSANCDHEQIMQVLLNLLLNAIQILPKGGKIEVSVNQLAQLVEIKIADNGIGIPEEEYEQIFDPFFTKR
ncbi:MAG: ATP-binding protein, partial [Methylophilaceae bacterium]